MSDSDPGVLSDRVEMAQERFQYGQGAVEAGLGEPGLGCDRTTPESLPATGSGAFASRGKRLPYGCGGTVVRSD